jgi:PBP4 family serine-type D-alanyl-D-alanine carboxypeptidase
MFLLFFLPLLTAPVANASPDWLALLSQNRGNTVYFGVNLGGTEPFQLHEEEEFAPASTAKLFTAAAALAELGPDYQYLTLLRWTEIQPGTASNLTLVGSGDPSWGLSELKEGPTDRIKTIAMALKEAGITKVQGDVSVRTVDPRWNSMQFPEGWKIEDRVNCEGSLAEGFNVGLNCASFTVQSSQNGKWNSPALSYPVELAIQRGRKTELTVRALDHSFRIEGTWKPHSKPQTFSLPIYDTAPWVTALFRNALIQQGIIFSSVNAFPQGNARTLEFYSPPLSELIKPFLKNSINMMGDSFLKSLVAPLEDTGSDSSLLLQGLSKLSAFLENFVGREGYTLHDGSGLSRTSRVTPSFIFKFLERASRESWFPALYAALPIAGIDGTLQNRMKGTKAEGELRAKTGTLEGVYNLAGYVPSKGGFVPFVLYTRTAVNLEDVAKAAENRVGVQLATLYSDSGDAKLNDEPYPFIPEHGGQDAIEPMTPPYGEALPNEGYFRARGISGARHRIGPFPLAASLLWL